MSITEAELEPEGEQGWEWMTCLKLRIHWELLYNRVQTPLANRCNYRTDM